MLNGKSMKNEIEIQIRVPNQTQYLRLIGTIGESVARELCHQTENRDAIGHYLNVVLTEAMANAIKHANAADPDKEIRIRVTITGNTLRIKVYDYGIGFDLNTIPCPIFNSNCLKETGRGIFIIRSLMDTVVYKRTKRGNVLEMKKLLK